MSKCITLYKADGGELYIKASAIEGIESGESGTIALIPGANGTIQAVAVRNCYVDLKIKMMEAHRK